MANLEARRHYSNAACILKAMQVKEVWIESFFLLHCSINVLGEKVNHRNPNSALFISQKIK